MSVHALVPFRSYIDDEPTLREVHPWHRRRPQCVESLEDLSLPEGLREDMLDVGAAPVGPDEARIWLVRIVRELGRQYRQWYGVELQTNAPSIERMQWHLSMTTRSPRGRLDQLAVAREVVRHGLLLGEILVRSLGATWVDLSGERPGNWQLFVAPGESFSPIQRVQRFVQQGMCGPDLLSLFLDLDTAQRRGDR